MGDFENTIQVNAPAQVLFDYLADIDAVRTGAQLPNGYIVEGKAWFGVDRAAMRMAWGSEGPQDYHDELAVLSADGGATGAVKGARPRPRH